MKTVKKLTAIFLCFVMLLGVGITSASALEIGDTVEWDFADQINQLIYKGTVVEGDNIIDGFDCDDYPYYRCPCYEFEVEKSGYYLITSEYSYFSVFADSYSNNKATSTKRHIDEDFENGMYSTIVYLSKGLNLLIIYQPVKTKSNISIAYFAESITNIIFENNTFYVFDDYDYINEETKIVRFPIKCHIEFSNSKVVVPDENEIECSFESNLTLGENTVNMLLPGFEKEINIYLCNSTDFIENIEIPNAKKYLNATETYNKHYIYTYFDDEDVTVNYKDGTSQTIRFSKDNYIQNGIILPCGRQLYVDVYLTCDESNGGTGKFSLMGYVGIICYYKKECSIEKASIRTNIEELKDSVSYQIAKLNNNCKDSINTMLETKDYASGIKNCLIEAKIRIEAVFYEVSLFINYYI